MEEGNATDQWRIECRQWSVWKLTGLGGGGAGTSQSRSLIVRTGVAGLLSLEVNVAFKLANSSSDVTKRIDLRGGVTGMGAAIWLGMMLNLWQNVSLRY